jgi:hypothetical protein
MTFDCSESASWCQSVTMADPVAKPDRDQIVLENPTKDNIHLLKRLNQVT